MREDGRKLNLVMTYPVWWSMRHIMEDYIQNFYDSIGAERFFRDFIYLYDGDNKTLRMEGRKGFSMDWLQYMGVSTKRDDAVHHTAGRFGEGFKIASLCAFRDYKMSIHMESMDWALDVVKIPGEIDGRNVDFLGYDIRERANRDDSVLLLGNVEEGAYQDFLNAIQSFFYPENPVFGECIESTQDYAVYELNLSGVSKGHGVKGKVFASMQKRAEISGIPIVFCNHSYEPDKEDDRDSFRSHDIENAVMEIVSELEGEALRKVFLAFEPHWNKSGKREAYGPDWGRLIRRTVYELCDDPVSGQCIREYLTGKYIADMDSYTIRQNRNKYGMAVTWFRTSKFHGTYKLLPFYFSEFGIDTIYSLCEKHDGFHIIHVPNELERNRIGILERMARDIFPDMLVYEKLPECRVIVNRGTPNTGLARTEDGVVPARNGIGLKAVSEIREISLRKELFCCDAFPEAMVVYMHELLHQFGGDASRQFRTAILAMDYRIIKEARRLETYEREWEELG